MFGEVLTRTFREVMPADRSRSRHESVTLCVLHLTACQHVLMFAVGRVVASGWLLWHHLNTSCCRRGMSEHTHATVSFLTRNKELDPASFCPRPPSFEHRQNIHLPDPRSVTQSRGDEVGQLIECRHGHQSCCRLQFKAHKNESQW